MEFLSNEIYSFIFSLFQILGHTDGVQGLLLALWGNHFWQTQGTVGVVCGFNLGQLWARETPYLLYYTFSPINFLLNSYAKKQDDL